MKFDVDDKNRCRLVCVKFHLNRWRFAAAVAKCLGGSLLLGHSVYQLYFGNLPSCHLFQASLHLWFYQSFYKWFHLTSCYLDANLRIRGSEEREEDREVYTHTWSRACRRGGVGRERHTCQTCRRGQHSAGTARDCRCASSPPGCRWTATIRASPSVGKPYTHHITWQPHPYHVLEKLHRRAEKKEPMCIYFNTWQKLVNFFRTD